LTFLVDRSEAASVGGLFHIKLNVSYWPLAAAQAAYLRVRYWELSCRADQCSARQLMTRSGHCAANAHFNRTAVAVNDTGLSLNRQACLLPC
jgi:hypothetical protein